MKPSFLLVYLDAFHDIEGWFSFDAALLFMAYNQFLAKQGVTGDVLEIGVYHGLSAIATATLRGPGSKMVVVDLFEELQGLNVSHAGIGNRALFERNMLKFHPNLDFLRIIAKPSSDLSPAELGSSFSFCHIDGGHSSAETLNDLRLCHDILLPGGLLALDDYFNPRFPGVCEGATEFMRDYPEALRPLMIGFNKVLFQKDYSPARLNTEFLRSFPMEDVNTVCMWGRDVLWLEHSFCHTIDIYASTP